MTFILNYAIVIKPLELLRQKPIPVRNPFSRPASFLLNRGMIPRLLIIFCLSAKFIWLANIALAIASSPPVPEHSPAPLPAIDSAAPSTQGQAHLLLLGGSAVLNLGLLGLGLWSLQRLQTCRRQQQAIALVLGENQRQLNSLIYSLPGVFFSRINDGQWSMGYLSQGGESLTGDLAASLTDSQANVATSPVTFATVVGALEQVEAVAQQQLYNAMIDAADLAHLLEAIGLAVAQQRSYEVEYRIRSESGEEKWLWEKGKGVSDRNGVVLGVEGLIMDITEIKRSQVQLQQVAFHDQLTQLPNRTVFMERLQQAMRRIRYQESQLFAVLYLDLDRFKIINDSLGHLAGDQLLIGIAERLQHCLRPTDTVSRMGGDEFTLLLEDIEDVHEVTQISDRILKSLSVPFNLNGHEVFTSASIGIALSSPDNNQMQDLLRDADIALYHAKGMGKGCYAIFDAQMHAEAVNQLNLETDLRRALERQEFQLYYQPIVCLETGKLIALEALLRWQHPQKGLVLPPDFLPIAEETGLILAIGRWVLQEACLQMRIWQEQFALPPEVTVNVNLSQKQFKHTELVQDLQEVLQQSHLTPQNLSLEISESVLMHHPKMVAAKLTQLKALGIQLWIDDFGTGYSSLRCLDQFPMDMLKIDVSFIRSMGMDGNKEIIHAIMILAASLQMGVIAEGVELASQLVDLKGLKCKCAQGYFFAPPLDPDASKIWLQQQGQNPIDTPLPAAIPLLILPTPSGPAPLPLVGNDSWLIGRSRESAIVLGEDRCVSKHHALVQTNGNGEYYLLDLGSSNGTFVNGQRVSVSVLLKHGDRLLIGKTEMEFWCPTQRVATFPTPQRQKKVLMVQPIKNQGAIWQVLLNSQNIGVIWLEPEVNLTQILEQLLLSQQILPDLLLLDLQNFQPNPYAFCRWCRRTYPEIRVLLTSSNRTEIAEPERRWAIEQGALNLLPGFQPEKLLTQTMAIAERVNLVLQALDSPLIQETSLTTILYSLQAELHKDTLSKDTLTYER